MINKLIKFFPLVFLLLFSFSQVAVSDDIQVQKAPVANHAQSDFQYKVLVNDTLSQILKRYCRSTATWADLAQYNHIENEHFLTPGQTIQIPAELLKAKTAPIEIMVFSGDVSIKKTTKTNFEILTAKHVVEVGDIIKTGERSLAKLRFADASVVSLQSNSSVEVEVSEHIANSSTYKIKLNLSQGRAEVEANPNHQKGNHLEVETPSATAVVRGTKFRISADGEVSTQETLEGAVSFNVDEKAVLVGRDLGSVGEKGKPPLAPTPLPDAPSVDGVTEKFEYLPLAFNLAADAKLLIASVSKDKAFTKLLVEDTVKLNNGNGVFTLNTLPDGHYFLKLRAQDSLGLQSRDVVHAFEVDVLPLAPVIDVVASEAKTSSGMGYALDWFPVPGSGGYVIQVADDPLFEHVLLEDTVSYDAYFFAEAVPENGAFWRVAARRNGKVLKFSQPQKISN